MKQHCIRMATMLNVNGHDLSEVDKVVGYKIIRFWILEASRRRSKVLLSDWIIIE